MRGNNGTTAPWTAAEDAWIHDCYPTAMPEKVDAALPGRTRNAIKHRASRLGIKKAPATIAATNSLTNSGRVRTADNRAKISQSLRGLRQSEETRSKRAATHRRIAKRGPANANWRGSNITPDESRWRARQMIAPGPCAVCGEPGKHVHHRDGDPMNNAPENLVRLCPKHHRREHARMRREARLSLQVQLMSTKPEVSERGTAVSAG